jgi:hypothetical protein
MVSEGFANNEDRDLRLRGKTAAVVRACGVLTALSACDALVLECRRMRRQQQHGATRRLGC